MQCGPKVSSKQVEEARRLLEVLKKRYPGRAVEVRVPFVGAIQAFEGVSHRRGTPPAVVEMSVATWIALANGELSWADAEENGLVDASGERTDLGKYLPL